MIEKVRFVFLKVTLPICPKHTQVGFCFEVLVKTNIIVRSYFGLDVLLYNLIFLELGLLCMCISSTDWSFLFLLRHMHGRMPQHAVFPFRPDVLYKKGNCDESSLNAKWRGLSM